MNLSDIQKIVDNFKESLSKLENHHKTQFDVIFFQHQPGRVGHAWLEPTLISTVYDVEPKRLLIVLCEQHYSQFCKDIHSKHGFTYIPIDDLNEASSLYSLRQNVPTRELRLGKKILLLGNDYLWSRVYSSVMGLRNGLKPILKRRYFYELRSDVYRRHAIPFDKRLITLHVRDDGWTGVAGGQNFRSSNVQNYKPCIEFLVSKGYFVVRVGDKSMMPIEVESSNFCDLTQRTAFVDGDDVILIANSDIYIGTSSGPMSIPILLSGIPVLSVNEPNLMCPFAEVSGESRALNLTLLKKQIDLRSGTVKNLATRTLDPSYHRKEQFDAAQVLLEENSAEDLKDAVEEMLLRITGCWDVKDDLQTAKNIESLSFIRTLIGRGDNNLFSGGENCFYAKPSLF